MIGVGTIFQRYSLGTWTSIAEILSINVEGEDRDAIDVTTLDTDEGYVDEISGLREGGEVVLSMIFSRGMFELLFSDFNLNTSGQYRIALQDADETVFAFNGFVIDMDEVEEVSDKITASITIKITEDFKIEVIYPRYGLLYNQWALTDSRGILPDGYHIPSLDQWWELYQACGQDFGKLRTTGTEDWVDPNTGATNEFGFNLFPAGERTIAGFFQNLNQSSSLASMTFGAYGVSYYYLYITEQTGFNSYPVGWTPPGSKSFISIPKVPSVDVTGKAVRCIRNTLDGYVDGEIVKDSDRNCYHTVKIGNQVWLAENLAVTHYKNGDLIREVIDDSEWSTLGFASEKGALCAYNNDWRDVFES